LNRITINLNNSKSEIYIGLNWNEFSRFIPVQNTVIITDDNIKNIYGSHFPQLPVFSVKPGEESKTLQVVTSLTERLLECGIDRSGFLVGIGGGVVCDLTGFLASIYMRGIRFGFVSTSLLSQVDASVGGKNAVNLGKVKNVLGCFRQPEFVICDPQMLNTLPEEEYLSGLAELIKMGLIMDYNLFSLAEQNRGRLLNRDIELLEYMISVSVELKASVVREDEKEVSGKRMILNFGHTFGHVIETMAEMKHGFAVAAGMVIASDISVQAGLLEPAARDRIVNLLKELKLIKEYNVPDAVFEEMLLKDKKKQGDNISFVLLESPGKAVISKINTRELMEFYKVLKRS